MGTNITGIGNANAIGFKSRVTGGIYFPPELKDALVGVWSAYGKSNDSTDRNIIKNKIKDRGGDFVISNAAFKLNSGFGGFVEDFTSWDRIDSSTAEISNDGSKIKCINTTLNVQYLFNYINRDISSFKVKISNFTKGDITYYYRKEDGIEAFFKITPLSVVNSDKVIELPKSYNTVENGTGSRGGFYSSNINIGVTIEQIPSFEGAFVTDGVNDLITSTKTVQEMGITDEITVVSMIHKISSDNNWTNLIGELKGDHTFVANRGINTDKTGIYGYTYNYNENAIVINNILGDKNDYIVKTSTSLGLDNKYYVTGFRSVGIIQNISQVAWYWTFIANRVLTTDEINQVIAYFNLDKYVKPDIYYNVKKQGLTNDTPDEDWYLKDFSGNGRDMTLYNYARTPESGINEEGGLQSDGVVDYGQFVGDLGLKDYTVVIDRAYNNLINNQVPLISSNIVEDKTPFIVEHWNTGSNAISFSYGASRITDIPLDINKKIVYQSTYSYMGYVIPKGNAISTGNGITLGKFGNGVQYSAICLWSLMLFPYSMSEFLIERQLKKHKLGTLYPDMVEFRPVINSNVLLDAKPTFVIRGTSTYLNAGDYVPENSQIWVSIKMNNAADRITKFTVNGKTINIPENAYSEVTLQYGFPFRIDSKSPQKINITIDEYIRFEDIVQPYPLFFEFTDENGNLISWGGKAKVGNTITRSKSVSNANILAGLYNTSNYKLNGKPLEGNSYVVEKQMVFTCTATYLFDNNEPKCILSPRLLRIPNSSYKILGHIPDISGHGNHGKINNSAYKLNSGVNGYLVDFTTLKDDGIKGIVRTDSKIYLDKSFNYNQGFWLGCTNNPSPAYKVKVSGIPETGMLTYTGGVWLNLVNGINELPARTNTEEEHGFVIQSPNLDWSNLVIEQIGEYEGAYCFDGVDDFVTIPTTVGGKQVLMKVNWDTPNASILYDQRGYNNEFAIYNGTNDSDNNPIPAYQGRNNGQTYIDGILNNNINASELRNITHNITITNELSAGVNTSSPVIGSNRLHNDFFANMALYDFMLFDDISTDDKIKQLNEYVGIEGNTE